MRDLQFSTTIWYPVLLGLRSSSSTGSTGSITATSIPIPISTILSPVPQASNHRWFLRNDKDRVRVFFLLTVILGSALALTYLQYASVASQNSDLQSRLAQLQSEAGSYHTQLQNSQNQNSHLQSEVSQLQSQNTYLTNEVQSLNLQPAHPTLTIWTSCGNPCSLTPSSWLAGGVPDTFTYDLSYTADVSVGVYLLSLPQYVQFANCSAANAGSNISCVSGNYYYYSPTTSLNGVFHLAEGCAGYVAIYYSDSSGVMYPDVSVTYNPASSSTGVCAG